MAELEPLTYPLDQQGTRQTINTPGLVIDLDALEFNIAHMAKTIREAGCALRPHIKTHKCPKIAKLQIEAGAAGICCATLDEAEIMAAEGIPGILITSPIAGADKISRLTTLQQSAPGTMIVADNPDNLAQLGQAAREAGRSIPVVIDIDIGQGRTGATSADAAEALGHTLRQEDGLAFAGVQAFGGHLQHIGDYDARLERCREAHQFIGDIVGRLTSIGMPPPMVTGSGTGAHMIDSAEGPFSEIQAGSYVFMDAEYHAIDYQPGAPWPFKTALFVQTTIISVNHNDMATTDAGTKAFAVNGPPPPIATAGYEQGLYEYTGDEHGRVDFTKCPPAPPLGARLECIVSHCDPTVSHYDRFHCVRGDTLVGIWPVSARGRR